MPLSKDLKNFEYLYKEHFVFLSLVSYNITKDKDAAKDIVQDFFIYLWEKEDEVNFTISFKAYSAKAVKNLSLQHIDKSKKITLENTKIIFPKFEEQDVFENAGENEKSRLLGLVDKIPPARREIFISHVIEGHSYVEIAETHNISINTVKTQMKRAYAFLREYDKNSTIIIAVGFLIEKISGN